MTDFVKPTYEEEWNDNEASVSALKGLTLASVVQHGNEAFDFTTTDGRRFAMYHRQDCCESVCLESVVGDLNDLIGEPLLIAEEVSGVTKPDGWEPGKYTESYTWTFYKFATRKGYVDMRWLGESNGYYSESVDFVERSRA